MHKRLIFLFILAGLALAAVQGQTLPTEPITDPVPISPVERWSDWRPPPARQESSPNSLPDRLWLISWFCPCEICCGKWAHYNGGGWTFSGTRAAAGRTVAVDPKVVPLGSRLYIEGLGWFVAEDTGSAVRGYHIDVFCNTHAEAVQKMQHGCWKRKVVVER